MRNTSLDILRIISCLLVVCIHGTLNYKYGIDSLNNSLALAGQSLFRIGLPVFFMISGFFLLNSRVNFSFVSLVNRIIKLLVPFFIFSLVHWLLINERASISLNGLPGYFNALITRNAISVHFWFVYSMVGIYIISQPLNYIISKIPDTYILHVTLAIAALIFYNGDMSYISSVLPIPGIEKWTSYFIIGGLLARLKDRVSMITSASIFIIGYTSIVIFSHIYASMGKAPPYDNSVFMIAACSGIMLIFAKATVKSNSLISVLAAATYGAYLIHICVLKYVSEFYFDNIHMPGVDNYYLSGIKVSIITFILSMLISSLVTPLIDKLIAQQKK